MYVFIYLFAGNLVTVIHDRTQSDRGLYSIQVKRADILAVIRGFTKVALEGNPRTQYGCVQRSFAGHLGGCSARLFLGIFEYFIEISHHHVPLQLSYPDPVPDE